MKNFLLSLIEQEKLDHEPIISIIGAGGKTTLLYLLADELSKKNKILLTTTTHMYYPTHFDNRQVVTNEDLDKIKFSDFQIMFLGKKEEKKVGSLSHDFLLNALSFYNQMIIEADGAKCMNAKIKNDSEPVIIDGCNCVIQVVGMSCLKQKIKNVLFRYKLACDIFDVSEDTLLDIELLKKIILYNFNGLNCNKKIVICNQVDVLDDLSVLDQFRNFPYPIYFTSLKNKVLLTKNINFKEKK